MGGLGSGRRAWTRHKRIAGDTLRLDVRRLQREGSLVPRRQFALRWAWPDGRLRFAINVQVESDRLNVAYRRKLPSGEPQDEEYAIPLEWTACHYGGKRVWFICPGIGCGQRVAILYFDGLFGCRWCHRLVHASTRESAADRLMRRLEKLRMRLAWPRGLLNPRGQRPPGMQIRTYRRLVALHDETEEAVLARLGARVHRITGKIDQVNRQLGKPPGSRRAPAVAT